MINFNKRKRPAAAMREEGRNMRPKLSQTKEQQDEIFKVCTDAIAFKVLQEKNNPSNSTKEAMIAFAAEKTFENALAGRLDADTSHAMSQAVAAGMRTSLTESTDEDNISQVIKSTVMDNLENKNGQDVIIKKAYEAFQKTKNTLKDRIHDVQESYDKANPGTQAAMMGAYKHIEKRLSDMLGVEVKKS